MVQDPGVALKQVTRDLDLNENMLRRWFREFGEDPQDAFPGLGQMKPEQAASMSNAAARFCNQSESVFMIHNQTAGMGGDFGELQSRNLLHRR